MIKRSLKAALYVAFYGGCVVLGIWGLNRVFQTEVSKYGYLSDLVLGVGGGSVISITSELKKLEKRKGRRRNTLKVHKMRTKK